MDLPWLGVGVVRSKQGPEVGIYSAPHPPHTHTHTHTDTHTHT